MRLRLSILGVAIQWEIPQANPRLSRRTAEDLGEAISQRTRKGCFRLIEVSNNLYVDDWHGLSRLTVLFGFRQKPRLSGVT